MDTAAFQKLQDVGFLWLIPLFPLVGAALNGILGKPIQDRFGKRANHGIAVFAMTLSAAVACYGFAKLLGAEPDSRTLRDTVFPMIHVGPVKVDFALTLDQLSGTLALIITLIGTGIHVYSIGYMAEEKAYWRFFCYLNLFVFSMLLLVLGDNFVLMFFGWEGVGLCSYLLIGFWYTDIAKATAGMKAFVVNRIGDFAFISGLFLLFWSLGGRWTGSGFDVKYLAEKPRTETVARADPSAHEALPSPAPPTEPTAVAVGPTVSFYELRQQLSVTRETGRVDAATVRVYADHLAGKEIWGLPVLFLVCLLFFIGATGKSAQIPLYVWLPDAMAGPTPVSALIHAATMVTAGVYMIARLNFLYWLSPGAMTVVASVGALTALFAATMGLLQYDIKKVLAYSTVSQLGYMFLGVGVGAWWAGVFHLVTHACFKACLFLGSGSVIHGMHFVAHKGHESGHGHGKPPDQRLAPDPTDPQDMRNMGGLAALMPATRMTYLIACIAITGLIPPIAAGFFSKDEILWKTMANGTTLVPGLVLWAIGFLAAGCTSFYMWRSYYMTFHYRPATEDMRHHVHESPRTMTWVLWALAGACLVIGAILGLPQVFAGTEPVFERWLDPVTSAAPFRAALHSHGLEIGLMLASTGIAAAGFVVARFFYRDATVTEARMADLKLRFAPVHRLLYHKYWVDEIYQATFVRGFMLLARILAWFDRTVVDGLVNLFGLLCRASAALGGWIDRLFVDGAVNGLAQTVLRLGREGRKVQTGRINQYVYGVVLGIIALFVITSFVS